MGGGGGGREDFSQKAILLEQCAIVFPAVSWKLKFQ